MPVRSAFHSQPRQHPSSDLVRASGSNDRMDTCPVLGWALSPEASAGGPASPRLAQFCSLSFVHQAARLRAPEPSCIAQGFEFSCLALHSTFDQLKFVR